MMHHPLQCQTVMEHRTDMASHPVKNAAGSAAIRMAKSVAKDGQKVAMIAASVARSAMSEPRSAKNDAPNARNDARSVRNAGQNATNHVDPSANRAGATTVIVTETVSANDRGRVNAEGRDLANAGVRGLATEDGRGQERDGAPENVIQSRFTWLRRRKRGIKRPYSSETCRIR